MFVNLFRKDNGDYYRYWASVSTEIYDAKKGKKTGEYTRANISVRLSKDCVDVFEDVAKKTSDKKIIGARFEVTDMLLEAVEPRDEDEYPYVRLVILKMKDANDAKPAKKTAKKSAKDDEDA